MGVLLAKISEGSSLKQAEHRSDTSNDSQMENFESTKKNSVVSEL